MTEQTNQTNKQNKKIQKADRSVIVVSTNSSICVGRVGFCTR